MKVQPRKKKRCLVCERVLTKANVAGVNPFICKTCMGFKE